MNSQLFFPSRCQHVKWEWETGFCTKSQWHERERTRLILHSYNAVLPLLHEPFFLFPHRCFIAVAQHRKKGHRAQSLLCICDSDIDDEALYWAHLLFILQLTIIINCRLCTRLLVEYALSFRCSLSLILTSHYISFHITCKTVFVLLQILKLFPTSHDKYKLDLYIYLKPFLINIIHLW